MHWRLRGDIVAAASADARLPASLYNAAGRHGTLKTDMLIAVIAVRANASLLTVNLDDVRPFLPHGLVLAN